MNIISEARWRITERRLVELRAQLKRTRADNKKLKRSLLDLASLFDADANGEPMISWYSESDIVQFARYANKLLGREVKVGRRKNA